jgi:hypothetical protein
MYVGSVDLGLTNFKLIVVPLKGTRLNDYWDADTDLLLVCHVQSGRFCTCNVDQDPDRFQDKLKMGRADAEALAEWLKEDPSRLGIKRT